MANVATWKSFHRRMGYSPAGAEHLTQNEKVKTMSALRRLDARKLSLIGKRMVNPGGTTASIAVTASAELNLATAAYIARYWERASRPHGPADIVLDPPQLFEEAEIQEALETDWGNTSAVFNRVVDSDLKDGGFRRVVEDLDENLKLVRGAKGTLLAYLRRPNILVKPHDDDDEANYVTKDEELIARMPIVLDDHVDDPIADLEAGGAATRFPHANRDNAILFSHVKKVFGKCSIWVHALDAVSTQDGRLALRLLELNMMGKNELDSRDELNNAKIRSLRWYGQKRDSNWEKYIQEHKRCHSVQLHLHKKHGYNMFSKREMVTMMLRGMVAPGCQNIVDLVTNQSHLREDFNEAQLAIAAHIKSVNARVKDMDTRAVAGVDISYDQPAGRGHGARGRGGGRGRGPGGRGRGTQSRGGRLAAYKNSDGTFKTREIINGQHDAAALRLTHIDKFRYSNSEFAKLNPLERRKLTLNREAQNRGEEVPTPTNSRISAISSSSASSDDPMRAISALTSTVTNLASAMKDQSNDVKELATAAKKIVSFQDEGDSSSSEGKSNRNNTALVRGNLKKRAKYNP